MKSKAEIQQLGRSVSRMALPVLVEQLFIVFMGAINTILASNLGKEAISAIGMVDTISIIIISLFSALAIGGTVVVAQYTGHNNPEKANHAAAQALSSCLAIAVVITLLILALRKPLLFSLFGEAEPAVLANAITYLSISLWSYVPIAMITIAFGILRGSGNTRTPMIISILMNFFNVVFSYFLIYGINLGKMQTPAFGVAGAATGLTLARTLGAALVLTVLFRGSSQLRLNKWAYFRFDTELQKCIFTLGVPASAEQLMFNGGKLIVQTFIVSLGTVSIAANTIVNSVSSILSVPGMALSIAAPAIVGQQIGAGQPQQAKKQLQFLVFAAMAANVLVSLILLPFSRSLLSLYTHDPATLDMAVLVLLVNLVV
ncbi:MAG TPA: MATE family efflux transporter [Clostridiales bacterium]|nr:MATE family efflux transporter [Clostridiales bacterium]